MTKLADLIKERNQILAHVDTSHTGFSPHEAARLTGLVSEINYTIQKQIEMLRLLSDEEAKQCQYHENQAVIHNQNMYAAFNRISALEKQLQAKVVLKKEVTIEIHR